MTRPRVFKRAGRWYCQRRGLIITTNYTFDSWTEAVGHALGRPPLTGSPTDYTRAI